MWMVWLLVCAVVVWSILKFRQTKSEIKRAAYAEIAAFNRAIDEWCNDYTLFAARTLNQVAADAINNVESELDQATWKDGLVNPTAFIRDKVVPKIRELAEPAAQMIIEEANRELAVLVKQRAVWVRRPEATPEASGALEGVQDIAVAAGPIAGGIAAVSVLPFAAITTTTAWLGLVTTTAISWPVVVGVSSVAGIALATGAVNSSRLWDKTKVRLQGKVRKFITDTLIDGTANTPSILAQISETLSDTAERATRP